MALSILPMTFQVVSRHASETWPRLSACNRIRLVLGPAPGDWPIEVRRLHRAIRRPAAGTSALARHARAL